MKAEQSDNDREPVLWGKQFAGKITEKVVVVGGDKCGCDARNTYTLGAKVGKVNE